MKIIKSTATLKVPEGVELSIKNRFVTVKGKRGSLKKDFSHAGIEMFYDKESRTVTANCFMAKKKKIATVRSVLSNIKNMIEGLEKGYRYRMKLVYSHFPINLSVSDDKTHLEIRNFLGEKLIRYVDMKAGCKIDVTGEKDELKVEGNDLEMVTLSCSAIHDSCKVREKDIRKFLDGIYICGNEHVEKDD